MEHAQGDFRFHADFRSQFLEHGRTVAVYLPPGYWVEPEEKHPVLYLHDGQNVFDATTAAFGVEWGAGATADRLIGEGKIDPLIIVAIFNTSARIDEYTPHRDPRRDQGGKGADYARFVVEELKPFIDREYRTRPEREHTAVAGSSLGGLISLAIAWLHPDVFSMCGAMSPSLWWMESEIWGEFDRRPDWPQGIRFWIDMGTRETQGAEDNLGLVLRSRELVERLQTARLRPGIDYRYLEVKGGEHSEAAWAARFDQVLTFFFSREFPGITG
ncbi:MAG TPA: alpha/beta hydrolase-fold protein [Planctomycetia bacterium]|nr:alpha/beta hydrolase-fold protein [Planctomycetia bacterium]